MSLVHNERLKLSATALNNASVGTVVTGLIAPSASFLYGVVTPSGRLWWLVALAWLSGAIALHAAARLALKGLKP
ncbi:MAG: hypothetical protein ACRYGM_14895 [Janthinobacterium lividum]